MIELTKEELLDSWKDYLHTLWSVPDSSLQRRIMEYITGKTDTFERSQKKYPLTFQKEWVEELDGDQAEIAKRMLRVVCELSNTINFVYGDYRYYCDICQKIGYSLKEMLQRIKDYGINFTMERETKIAKYLVDIYPEEVMTQFLDHQLEHRDWLQPKDRYLNLNLLLLAFLMQKYPQKCQMYQSAVFEIVKQLKAEREVASLLYWTHSLSEELKQLMIEHIQRSEKIGKYILLDCLKSDAGKFHRFLIKLEIPNRFYYRVLGILDEHITSAQHAQWFQQAYQDDTEEFIQTYQYYLKHQQENHLAPLVSMFVLLGEKAPTEDLERIEKQITHYWCNHTAFSEKCQEHFLAFLNDKFSLKEIAKEVQKQFNASRLNRNDPSQVALYLLYEKSQIVQKIVKFLFEWYQQSYEVTRSQNYAQFINIRHQWLDMPKIDSVKLLVEEIQTIKNFFILYFIYIRPVSDEMFGQIVTMYQQDAIHLLTDDLNDTRMIAEWITLLYGVAKLQDEKPLLKVLLNHSNLKTIVSACEAALEEREDLKPQLEELRPQLKPAGQEMLVRLFKHWGNQKKFGEGFAMMSNQEIIQFCEESLTRELKKGLSWIPKQMLQGLRFVDSNEIVPDSVLAYLLAEYIALQKLYRIVSVDKISQRINQQDLQNMLENIYQFWLENGAETKKKAFMLAYCIFASDTQIIRLRKQLEQWCAHSRGALASKIVEYIALNGKSVALMMIDSMATKFPNNQVKKAARAAFGLAASALEVSEDVLSDRIVPNLGLNRDGERIFDYGSRSFKVTLMPDFSFTIFDEVKQKTVKSLPKANASDDEEKAAIAKKEFSDLKKQLKTVIQTQTQRLERVLFNGRSWDVQTWNSLFVENPIMHRFATGLIWGIYEGDTCVQSFRYMDDGTFNTVDEEEFELPEKAVLSLVHPMDLKQEEVSAWAEQLEDYEVVQPFHQLDIPVVVLHKEELDGKTVIRYRDKKTTVGTLNTLAKKYDLQRGEILDAGCFYCYHFVDKYLGIGACYTFDHGDGIGLCVGYYENYAEELKIEKIELYQMKDGKTVDEPEQSALLNPENVSKRLLSTVLSIAEKMVISS